MRFVQFFFLCFILGSLSYSRAVAEQKLLFPDGVCCQETPDLKADEVKMKKDCFTTLPIKIIQDVCLVYLQWVF